MTDPTNHLTTCPTCGSNHDMLDCTDEHFDGEKGFIEYMCAFCGTWFLEHYLFESQEIMREGWD